MAHEPILIVDDNPQNRKLVRVLLTAAGYQVEAVGDADEALRLLRTFTPRLILMDLQMPGVDGLTLTRRLKADPVTRRIPVVALTAYAMKGDAAKAFEAGCDGYITKPIDVDRFPQAIAEHLARVEGDTVR